MSARRSGWKSVAKKEWMPRKFNGANFPRVIASSRYKPVAEQQGLMLPVQLVTTVIAFGNPLASVDPPQQTILRQYHLTALFYQRTNP